MPSCKDLWQSTLGMWWPFRNVVNVAQVQGPPEIAPDVDGNYSGGKLRPYHDALKDYLSVQFGQLPKIVLAALCWTYTVDMDAASKGYDFSSSGWVMQIVIRDLVLMLVICGGWDWLLYHSPFSQKLGPYKFNSTYPSGQQLRRDMFWTLSATLLASGQEILLMRWWADNDFKRAVFGTPPPGEEHVPWGDANPFFGTPETAIWSTPEMPLVGTVYFSEYTFYFIAWTMTMLYWRIAHFHLIHRGMHPWWDREFGLKDGDFGAVLYRYVHSHHHKSYNPTSWSGISMLPIESVAYISAALIPLFFRNGCHPWLHLYTKLDLIIGAQIGHDGFDAPGGGSYYHQLHHAHFECNYGDSAFPIDYWLGTFEDGSSFVKKAGVQKLKDEMNNGQKDDKQKPLLANEKGRDPERVITMDEVAQHKKKDDIWIVLHGQVLDVTDFISSHPGGQAVMLPFAGKDATSVFDSIHEGSGGFALVEKWAPNARVGVVPGWTLPEQSENQKTGAGSLADWPAQVVLNLGLVAVSVLSWIVLMGAENTSAL